MIKSNIVVNELDNNVYEVVPAPIIVAAGKRFRISPSYAYAGILPGTVKVVSIVTKEEYLEDTSKYPQIEEFIRIDEDMLEDTVDYTLWIEYKYVIQGYIDTDQPDINYLPIELFVQHITTL